MLSTSEQNPKSYSYQVLEETNKIVLRNHTNEDMYFKLKFIQNSGVRQLNPCNGRILPQLSQTISYSVIQPTIIKCTFKSSFDSTSEIGSQKININSHKENAQYQPNNLGYGPPEPRPSIVQRYPHREQPTSSKINKLKAEITKLQNQRNIRKPNKNSIILALIFTFFGTVVLRGYWRQSQ